MHKLLILDKMFLSLKKKVNRPAHKICNLTHIKCRLLITFANCLDPDQARKNVMPDLGPNCLKL